MKKAQMVTFDMSTTLVVFIIFIVIFIGVFFMSQRIITPHEFELEYVFYNLENNLKFDDESRRFITNYRVDSEKLKKFAEEVNDIDAYVIGRINGAHGIGMDPEGYDACLYFKDNDGSFLKLDSQKIAVGTLSKVNKPCHDVISSGENPCEEYKQATALIKPVLLDTGNPENNRIIQMNVVICKK